VNSKLCEQKLIKYKQRKISQTTIDFPIQVIGTLSVAGAPEPSTWAMLALGFAALSFVGRRRQRTGRLASSLG
jgi:PEP-CTERM motif